MYNFSLNYCELKVWLLALSPSQMRVSSLRKYPAGHSHWKLPNVLTQLPPWHKPGSSWHSSMSVPKKRKRTINASIRVETVKQLAVDGHRRDKDTADIHTNWYSKDTQTPPQHTHTLTLQNDSNRVGSETFSSRTQSFVFSYVERQFVKISSWF